MIWLRQNYDLDKDLKSKSQIEILRFKKIQVIRPVKIKGRLLKFQISCSLHH